MSIELSGGGSFAVTTEALLEAERMLSAVAARSREAGVAATACAALVVGLAPEVSLALRHAQHELGELALDAHCLAAELQVAADSYGWAERAAMAGRRLLAQCAGPLATVGAAVAALAVASALKGRLAGDDPRFVASLRLAADAVDLRLLVAGVQALPGPALEETPVDAVRVGDASVRDGAAAPVGFAALAERLPAAGADAPQVRVERYAQPSGEAHWLVYIAGTSDWAVTPGTNPWDDTSNAVGLAGGSAGSTRATVAALTKAGWQPGEPILPIGHSQGGIVATALAASGVATVPMLVTFGSPTAAAPAPPGALAVAFEHRNDPVPVLGGSPRLLDTRLAVRDVAPAGSGSGPIATHSMTGYAQTARELDASSDERAATARAALADFTGGQRAEVSVWRGERHSR